jgi:hypothetical protein
MVLIPASAIYSLTPHPPHPSPAVVHGLAHNNHSHPSRQSQVQPQKTGVFQNPARRQLPRTQGGRHRHRQVKRGRVSVLGLQMATVTMTTTTCLTTMLRMLLPRHLRPQLCLHQRSVSVVSVPLPSPHAPLSHLQPIHSPSPPTHQLSPTSNPSALSHLQPIHSPHLQPIHSPQLQPIHSPQLQPISSLRPPAPPKS